MLPLSQAKVTTKPLLHRQFYGVFVKSPGRNFSDYRFEIRCQ